MLLFKVILDRPVLTVLILFNMLTTYIQHILNQVIVNQFKQNLADKLKETPKKMLVPKKVVHQIQSNKVKLTVKND